MTDTLTEQAEDIVTKLFEYQGEFVFCDKTKAIFCVTQQAMVGYDDYAFEVSVDIDSMKKDLVKKIVDEMKEYCLTRQLEYKKE